MLKDVNVGMSHLLVRGAIILVVGIVFSVATDSVSTSSGSFGIGYREEKTQTFFLDQLSQVLLYCGEPNTVRFTYTNSFYMMKDIYIALDGAGSSLTAHDHAIPND